LWDFYGADTISVDWTKEEKFSKLQGNSKVVECSVIVRIVQLCFYTFYYRIIVVLEVHYDIYKSAYTISLPPPFSFISPFLEQFQQVSLFHFHIWVNNISTTFTLLHPFLTSSSGTNQRQELLYFPFLHFLKKHIFVYLR
jgi:hypothetical protein